MPTLVSVAVLMAIVSSLGAPLIPSIARADRISLSRAEWLLTAALMTGAVATPIMGRLADGPMKRRVIEVALGVVAAGCVLSAASTNFSMMVVGRGLQGVGLGLLPVTMAIARSELPAGQVSAAVGTLSVTTAVGVGLGYPLTGLISQILGFRAAFWFGASAVMAALVLVMVVLPKRSSGSIRRFDLFGTVSLGLSIVGISIVLSEGGEWGWSAPGTAAVAVSCVVLLGLWVRHELRVPDPLIDVRQVRNRSVLTADVSAFLIGVAMYLFLPIIVEFVQVPAASGYGFGVSIVVSGLIFVPLSIGSYVASRCLVVYERHFGTRSMIPLGSMIFAASTLFFGLEHRSLWEAFATAGFSGLGIGLTFAAMPGFIVRAVVPSETGSATGFYQLVRSVGLSVGSALAAAVLSAYTPHGQTFPSAAGFRVTLLTASALCATTAVVSYLLPGRTAAPVPPVADAVERLVEDQAEVAAVGLLLSGSPLGTTPEASQP
jgi:predicted MFS family arabinose efflux permease